MICFSSRTGTVKRKPNARHEKEVCGVEGGGQEHKAISDKARAEIGSYIDVWLGISTAQYKAAAANRARHDVIEQGNRIFDNRGAELLIEISEGGVGGASIVAAFAGEEVL